MRLPNIKIQLFFLLSIFFHTPVLLSQESEPTSEPFFYDGISFDSDSVGMTRYDMYAVVPYQSLSFRESGDVFTAKYKLTIKLFDSLGHKAEEKVFEGNIVERDYFTAQGGTARFKSFQHSTVIPPGSYNVEITLEDSKNLNTFTRNRRITVFDFDKYAFSVSGIMLISSIEENNGKMIITPHISEEIGNLKDGFFLFFESYNNGNLSTMDLVYEIRKKDDELLYRSAHIVTDTPEKINRHYIRVELPENISHGDYLIRVVALKPDCPDYYEPTDVLGASQRSMTYSMMFGNYKLDNLDKMISQLIYVADGDDLEYISKAENQDEKLKRFEDFWKRLDPTETTMRNEAFDEYYARIAYANKYFKSYTVGWRSDRGRVFIIYGRPTRIQSLESASSTKNYIRWIYSNQNRQFDFVDQTGFGDYRLLDNYPITDKYVYSH